MECIILITAHKGHLTPAEQYFLRKCREVLADYPATVVCPRGMNIANYVKQCPDLKFDFIASHWQRNYESFSRLKADPFLYQRYYQYEYILFYELDSLVFRDELDYWCDQGFGYIGASWFVKQVKGLFDSVGNGGFPLRKTDSLLQVTKTFAYRESPHLLASHWHGLNQHPSTMQNILGSFGIGNNFYHLLNNYYGPEDVYWKNCSITP